MCYAFIANSLLVVGDVIFEQDQIDYIFDELPEEYNPQEIGKTWILLRHWNQTLIHGFSSSHSEKVHSKFLGSTCNANGVTTPMLNTCKLRRGLSFS